jgi:hypothetical protein
VPKITGRKKRLTIIGTAAGMNTVSATSSNQIARP